MADLFRRLDEALLVAVLSFLSAKDNINGCRVCKLWTKVLFDTKLSKYFWQPSYMTLIGSSNQSYQCPLDHWLSPFIDWIGKYADISPLSSTTKHSVDAVEMYMTDVKRRITCRAGHTATILDDDTLVLFGGASHLFLFSNTCDMISLKNNSIISINRIPLNPPSPRWLHSTSTINSQVIIFGGQSNQGLENDMYLMSLSTPSTSSGVDLVFSLITFSGDVPLPRGGHSLIADDKHKLLILFGGMTDGQVCQNDLYSFQLNSTPTSNSSSEAGIWSHIRATGAAPSPRWCHSTVVVDHNMFVIGGWKYVTAPNSRHIFYNDVHMLNLESLVWTCIDIIGSIPRPRCQSVCWHLPSVQCGAYGRREEGTATSRGYIALFGGACHSEQDAPNQVGVQSVVDDLDDFHLLDLDTLAWVPVNFNFSRSRGGTNAIVLTPKGWLLSGGMHTETGAHIPRFKNDLVFLRPNLGGVNNPSFATRAREDLRIKSKFLFVDAK